MSSTTPKIMVLQRLRGHNLKYNIDYNLDSNQDLNLRLGICLFDLGFGSERPSCIAKKMFSQFFFISVASTKRHSKVQSVLQPRSAALVPSVCSTIFAKRSWQFWAQELENV